MHIIQRQSAVFLNIKRGVGGATSVAFPWSAVKLLVEDISFWPGFTFVVFGVDADIQKFVDLFIGNSLRRGDYDEKRQKNVRHLKRHVQDWLSLLIDHVLLACVATVSVRGERGPREGVRIRAARKMGTSKKRWKEGVGEGSEGTSSLRSPTPLHPPFCSFPFFARPECEKLPRAAHVLLVRKRLLRRLRAAEKKRKELNASRIELLNFVNQLKFVSFGKGKNNLSKEYCIQK